MTFKEFISLDEKNFRNHGGDRSGIHTSIKRAYKYKHKPFLGLVNHRKNNPVKKTSFFGY